MLITHTTLTSTPKTGASTASSQIDGLDGPATCGGRLRLLHTRAIDPGLAIDTPTRERTAWRYHRDMLIEVTTKGHPVWLNPRYIVRVDRVPPGTLVSAVGAKLRIEFADGQAVEIDEDIAEILERIEAAKPR